MQYSLVHSVRAMQHSSHTFPLSILTRNVDIDAPGCLCVHVTACLARYPSLTHNRRKELPTNFSPAALPNNRNNAASSLDLRPQLTLLPFTLHIPSLLPAIVVGRRRAALSASSSGGVH